MDSRLRNGEGRNGGAATAPLPAGAGSAGGQPSSGVVRWRPPPPANDNRRTLVARIVVRLLWTLATAIAAAAAILLYLG